MNREKKPMKRLILGLTGLVFLMNLFSCAGQEIVKVDLTSFNENPQLYEDKRVILKTDITTLVNDPTPYISKDIEISGFVKKGTIGLDWGFYLEDEAGESVKCYESKYRHYPWIRADMAVRKARAVNERMTIVGIFRKNFGIELDWIEYGGEVIDTDYKPYIPTFPI